MVVQPGIRRVVLEYTHFLPHLLSRTLPRPANLVKVFLSLGEVPEGQLNAGPFIGADAVVDGLSQELVVGRTGALRAPCPRPVKRELDRIQQRGLAASVQAAE